MSCAVDVNILLYASDTGSPFHQPASDFLQARAGEAELFCLAWPTLMSYLVALLLEHGVPLLYSNDSDFKKFSAIRVRDPFAA